MASSSTLWAKAEKTAQPVVKDLEFDGDLSGALDEFDTLVTQYLTLETKMYKVAKKLFLASRKLHRVADSDLETIREAAVVKNGKDKTTLDFLAADLENVMDNVSDTSVDELLLRARRELAIVKKVARILK